MKAVFSRISEGIADRGLDHANFVSRVRPCQFRTSLRKKKPKELDAESIWCNSNDSGLLGRNGKEREAKANEPHG
ncbi:hypothetical protein DY000_02033527 [Brassica cretica]|uniref:Uncharacterized protein n=1 Tax=Brassica cretica TaxID=69181 RepID=A0ABQ7DN42_BRACR|nr:hypothetical protein DY000_02033527 [Brassica cretica]